LEAFGLNLALSLNSQVAYVDFMELTLSENLPPEQKVVGSNPTGRTKSCESKWLMVVWVSELALIVPRRFDFGERRGTMANPGAELAQANAFPARGNLQVLRASSERSYRLLRADDRTDHGDFDYGRNFS
jgi:hypothetical protein